MPKDLCERYEICPQCKHDWIGHFQMIDKGELLHPPQPTVCLEGCGCRFAIESNNREGD